MIIRGLTWLMMAGLAALVGRHWSFGAALGVWAGSLAVACALGALLISSQPLSVVTWRGRVGSIFVQWGFTVSRGKIVPLTLISWLMWIMIGTAIIGIVRFPTAASVIVSWWVDALALLYLVGMMLNARTHAHFPRALIVPALVLVGMIAGSAALWNLSNSGAARAWSLAIAGGPLLVVSCGYAIFLAIAVTTGRGRRWQ